MVWIMVLVGGGRWGGDGTSPPPSATLVEWYCGVFHMPIRDEGEVPISNHRLGKMFHDGGTLDVEIF